MRIRSFLDLPFAQRAAARLRSFVIRWPRLAAGVAAVVVVLQLVFPRTPLGTIMRCDALALGVLIAIWSRHDSYRLFEPRFMANRWVRATLVLILLVGLAFIGGEDIHIPIEISMVAIIAAIDLIVSGVAPSGSAPVKDDRNRTCASAASTLA